MATVAIEALEFVRDLPRNTIRLDELAQCLVELRVVIRACLEMSPFMQDDLALSLRREPIKRC